MARASCVGRGMRRDRGCPRGPDLRPDHRAAGPALGGAGRRGLRAVEPARLARLRARRLPERPHRVRPRLRHGRPRARRADHARLRLLRGLGVEAVHRHGRGPRHPQGNLSADDDVRKYVPELPDYGRPITIRHLIHHTSGLRDINTLMVLAGRRDEDAFDNEAVLRILARQKALNFMPGDEHLYSNSGYAMLALAIERANGHPVRRVRRREHLHAAGHAGQPLPYGSLSPRARPRLGVRQAGGRDVRAQLAAERARRRGRAVHHRARARAMGRELLRRARRRPRRDQDVGNARAPEQRHRTDLCVGADGRVPTAGSRLSSTADRWADTGPTSSGSGARTRRWRCCATCPTSAPAQRPARGRLRCSPSGSRFRRLHLRRLRQGWWRPAGGTSTKVTSLKAFAGDYYSEELESVYRVDVDGDDPEAAPRRAAPGLHARATPERRIRPVRAASSAFAAAPTAPSPVSSSTPTGPEDWSSRSGKSADRDSGAVGRGSCPRRFPFVARVGLAQVMPSTDGNASDSPRDDVRPKWDLSPCVPTSRPQPPAPSPEPRTWAQVPLLNDEA